jgi:uncharacterized repeat protein (TIGR03803 family)
LENGCGDKKNAGLTVVTLIATLNPVQYPLVYRTGMKQEEIMVFHRTVMQLLEPGRFLNATVAFASVLLLAVTAWSQTEKVLYSFAPGRGGNGPTGSLVFDSAGNLYGTTQKGGDLRGCNSKGCGTLFSLSPTAQSWQESVVHAFTSFTSTGYNHPTYGLNLAADGSIYSVGVVPNLFGEVLMKYSKDSNGTWSEDLIYEFLPISEGPNPSLSFDAAGNLYGSSEQATAGEGLCDTYNCGTVFKLYPTAKGSWAEDVLYQFQFYPSGDGIWPISNLVADDADNLYGATQYGGSSQNGNSYGVGTVYELSHTASGWVEQVLYNFAGGRDGGEPTTTLIRDKAGNLYGLASTGGAYGKGALYKLSYFGGTWTESAVFSFAGEYSLPNDPLIIDDAGNLYGTTYYDGVNHWGTVVKLSPASSGWTEKVLYTFTGGSDGGQPRGGLVLDANGDLYGTTYRGGANGDFGVVFEITP